MRRHIVQMAVVLLVVVAVLATPAAARNGSARSVVGQQQGTNPVAITSIAFAKDSNSLVIANADGGLRLVRVIDSLLNWSRQAPTGTTVNAVAISADGQSILSASDDSMLRLSAVLTGAERRAFAGHEHAVRTVAIAGDGKSIATAGEDLRILIWDPSSGKVSRVLAGDAVVGTRQPGLPGHSDFINTLAYSPDGKTLASGSADNRIMLWDIGTGRPRRVLLGHAGAVNVVVFTPDGKTLASGGDDGTIRMWDVASGTQRAIVGGNGASAHKGPVRSLSFRDGKTFVSGGADSLVRVWQWDSASARSTQLRSLQAHSDEVTSVAYSPNGVLIASGSKDGRVLLWEAATGKLLRTLQQAVASIVGPILGASTGAGDPGTLARSPVGADAAARSSQDTLAASALADGPGGPILIVTSAGNRFGDYYTEILRAEGLNAFVSADIGTVSSATLAAYDVVVLSEMALTSAQATLFGTWVTGGGNLLAMRPDKQLAGLLGLTDASGVLSEGYIAVNTAVAPGNGITGDTMQFHGTADRYNLSGATTVATLYSSATTATTNPAVTLRSVGTSGGQAAAFTYDLARSIVYTRQGNVAWQGQERDSFAPIRSDDLYFGAASSDPQPDWVDLTKVGIPQADEQQRLLVNLVLEMNRDRKPLPRFWYLPRGAKAAVVMTGDDHANGGTAGRWDRYKADSPAGCNVADWECIRSTSYVFSNAPLTAAQAASYTADGFEVALHVNTGCLDWTPSSLNADYTSQLSSWQTKYASISAPSTNRTHCMVNSDWATQAKVSRNHGIRLDTNYYYWPPGWIADRPGFMTGSGMAMRFADHDGSILDVYQAATQLTDESGQTYPFNINTLLDRALGPQGYYGTFVINDHTDFVGSSVSDAVIPAAKSRNVPVISSRQLLNWLDGRNNSSFGSIAWSSNTLTFTVSAASGANGLQSMLPSRVGSAVLVSVTRDGTTVPFTLQGIKGIEYATFAATSGSYVATYAADTTAPTVSSTSPASGATGVAPGASISATLSEAIDAASVNASTVELRDASNNVVPATITYNAATRTATLDPNALLTGATTYTARVLGGAADPRVKDAAGNALTTTFTWSFTIAAPITCPCTIWPSSATPASASVADPNSVELGVKFRSEVAGTITGIRFYKGSGNTGTHIGSLWTSTGTRLAQATFINETASGWQQVSFPSPVAVTAGTTYIASYFTPNGRYAIDNGYFSVTGVNASPLYALRNGESGGNGVYRYSASSAFPNQTYNASNYWVDVVFTATSGPDATPPAISATTPASGATGVASGANVTATFNEALDPATVNATTFELRDASNNLVAANVSYDAATRTAVLDPDAALAASAAYTARVKGGAADPRIKDLAGNALATTLSWSFTTAATAACPCTIWPNSATPAVLQDPDTAAVELGVKFQATTNGTITGIRFYKGSGNTGTHIGSLWTSTGTRLAQATFINETASGWQQVSFPSPVAVTAGTTYIASYFAPNGRYSVTENYFGSGFGNAPLFAPGSTDSGGNGVYRYSASSAFPNQTYSASNYWVDVVFAP